MKFAFFLFLSLYVNACFGAESDFIGSWMSTDLDGSEVQMVKKSDGLYFGTIISSKNPAYAGQVIFKGKYDQKGNMIEGIFTTPKSKMNITTKIYLIDKNTIRFVGKKFFITKTYIWKRKI